MATEVGQQFAGTLSMQLLEPQLRQDLRRSLVDAIVAKAVFPCRARPLDIFRTAVSEAIGPHAGRLAKLLEDCDDPTSERPGKAKPDDYYWAVRFAVSRAVSAIQGSLAEMLALGPVAQLISELRSSHKIPTATRMWVGNSITAPSLKSGTLANAADVHLLVASPRQGQALLVGVVEVKSYRCSQNKATCQIANHLSRATQGLVMNLPNTHAVHFDVQLVETPLKVFVIPARWRLSRHFRFKSKGTRRWLSVYPPKPAAAVLALAQGRGEWRIALRWSNEALAAAAFEILLWCIGQLGEQVYTRRPSPWADITPAEAGQNAVKMTLYYTILHIDDPETLSQATKLYNVLGFGFALGSSFRGADGRPAMLWPEDLDEIFKNGKTSTGGYLEGVRPNKQLRPTLGSGASRRSSAG